MPPVHENGIHWPFLVDVEFAYFGSLRGDADPAAPRHTTAIACRSLLFGRRLS